MVLIAHVSNLRSGNGRGEMPTWRLEAPPRMQPGAGPWLEQGRREKLVSWMVGAHVMKAGNHEPSGDGREKESEGRGKKLKTCANRYGTEFLRSESWRVAAWRIDSLSTSTHQGLGF